MMRVLAVCTANHCRSPLMEFVLREAARERGLDWSVSSAGTRAVNGVPMHEYAARALIRNGYSIGNWASQALNPALIAHSDLILAASEEHRQVIVSTVPSALPRTFLLREFARLARAAEASASVELTGESLVVAARAARSYVAPVGPNEDDLTDPMGHRKRVFDRTLTEVQQAVAAIMTGFGRG